LGGNRGWALLALSGLSFLLLAVYLMLAVSEAIRTRLAPRISGIDLGAGLILLTALWLFIQAEIKLPLATLSLIAPVNADFYATAFKILQLEHPPATASISLDAGATEDRAMLTLSCFCILYLMGELITTRKRLQIFCYTIVLSGCFQAIYGVMMVLTGTEYLFLTPKTTYFGNATGTFVNRNHLAGYLEMTLAVGVGLLLGLRDKPAAATFDFLRIIRMISQILLSQIAIVRVMLILMVIGLIMTHSRMGNAAFFNALLITGGIAMISSNKFRKPGFYAILISIILLDILILGSVFDISQVVDRMENTGLNTETRDEVVKYGLTMLPDFWLTGSGAGTFAYVFPYYAKQYFGVFYDFAHNDYLQIFLEFGLLGMLPLVSYTVLGLIRGGIILRSGQSGLVRGMGFTAVMAGISLIIHSAVDFNLQIPANIVLFVAVLRLPWLAAKLPEVRIRQS
jgi:O-antigen ligase